MLDYKVIDQNKNLRLLLNSERDFGKNNYVR